MKTYQHPNELNSVKFGATIGNFDGVHLGHLAMLKEAKKECDKRSIDFVVITFFPHPAQLLKGARGFLINGYEQRRELLKLAGVEHLIEIPFTKDFSLTSPTTFIDLYIKIVTNFKLLCLGYDFAFGADKKGDAQTIKNQLEGTHVETMSLAEFSNDTQGVSSTAIREKIRTGKVDEVKALLGRNFSLNGQVIRGKGRGKSIGFPTANLKIDEEIIIPITGVYATKSILRGREYRSVTNIGFNPTFSDNFHMSIETNIFEQLGDFYDEKMSVEFLGKIRDEKRFSSVEDLKKQIALDARKASEWKSD